MPNLLRAAGLLVLLCPAAGRAQAPPAAVDPIAGSRAHYREAVRAYQAGDFAAFLEHARQAQALRPTHGGVTYALASAYALTGDTVGALTSLRRYAAMGYTADLAADSDFAALRSAPALAEISRRLAANQAPLVRGTRAFELPERDLLAEGVAYDAREGAFFVSAVHRRKIVRMTPDGRFADFAVLEGRDDGTPLGLVADAGRRALWVATATMPQMRGYSPADSGRSALLRYDLDSGKLTGRYPVPADGRAHGLGDLVITTVGDVYTSDSRAPVIYRLPAGADALVPYLESPLLTSAQGLALAPDGRTLFVADYARGILRANLQSREIAMMPADDSVAALGIDGLYYVDGALVGIQNGVAPWRVVRLRLSPEGDRILSSEPLERAHPSHDEPTLGVVVGHDLYYVANSQYERFTGDGRVAQPDSLDLPVVLRLRL
jgi:sugar lactone lactonase YvrE